jgi:hypothetical protein
MDDVDCLWSRDAANEQGKISEVPVPQRFLSIYASLCEALLVPLAGNCSDSALNSQVMPEGATCQLSVTVILRLSIP